MNRLLQIVTETGSQGIKWQMNRQMEIMIYRETVKKREHQADGHTET